MGRKPFFGYFQLWETYSISKFRILRRRKSPCQRVRVGRYFALFVIIISIPGKAFRQSNSRGHSFRQICYSLDFACSGSWLTAAFIFTYILQCIMGNYTVVTRNAPFRQVKTFYKSKTRSKHSYFHRPGTYYLSCNSPKYLFCALEMTCF